MHTLKKITETTETETLSSSLIHLKSSKSMRYDIFNRKAPAMPKPSKGTEFCKLLLSQASKDMQEPLVPMAIPALAAHLTRPDGSLDRSIGCKKSSHVLELRETYRHRLSEFETDNVTDMSLMRH